MTRCHLQLDSQSKLCVTYTWFRDIPQRMCNVWYVIRKSNGRQSDNSGFLILTILSREKTRNFYCYQFLIDLSKKCPVTVTLIQLVITTSKKLNLFVKVAPRIVTCAGVPCPARIAGSDRSVRVCQADVVRAVVVAARPAARHRGLVVDHVSCPSKASCMRNRSPAGRDGKPWLWQTVTVGGFRSTVRAQCRREESVMLKPTSRAKPTRRAITLGNLCAAERQWQGRDTTTRGATKRQRHAHTRTRTPTAKHSH